MSKRKIPEDLSNMSIQDLFDLLPINISMELSGPIYSPNLRRNIEKNYYLEYSSILTDVKYGNRDILFKTKYNKKLKPVLIEAIEKCIEYKIKYKNK